MKDSLLKLIGKIKRKLKRNYHVYNGVLLPPRDKRYLRESFFSDKVFYESTVQEGIKLTERLGVTKKTKILEIGCTTGRSFIGLLQKVPDIYYIGIDINRWNIEWCKKYLARDNPDYNFQYFDLKHVMYNPTGTIELNKDFRFQFESNYFDVVYATGVLPNYITEEVRIILKDFSRMLKTGGRLHITSFVEENVPDMEENPDNYLMKFTYPRQIVRYEKNFFDNLINEQGFRIDSFEHRTEIDFQSAYYLTKIR
jgi:ubiquinone/menaquinone biosynthesis C-methylase UbiE